MKTQYEKPTINVLDIAPCIPLAASGLDIDADSKGDFSEDFGRGHRGTWGNLWDESDM